MNKAILISAIFCASILAVPAAAQLVVSDAVIQHATLGANLLDSDFNTRLEDVNGNTDPLFTVFKGDKLRFGINAFGTFPDFLTATFGGSFFTLDDPNVNGVVAYPISTSGGNSYRQILTFDTVGSFSGTINTNLLVANPDYRVIGSTVRREAPTFTFRINVLETANAVPEPSTWALFVIGFGAVGASVRRVRSAARSGTA